MGVVDRLSMEKQALKLELKKAKARGDRYFEQAFEDRQKLLELQDRVRSQRGRLAHLDWMYNAKISDLGVVQYCKAIQERSWTNREYYWNLGAEHQALQGHFWKLYELIQAAKLFVFQKKNGKYICTTCYGTETWFVYDESVMNEDGSPKSIAGGLDVDEAIDFAKSLAEQN